MPRAAEIIADIGSNNQVIGIDKSTALLAEAMARTSASDGNIKFLEADVNDLKLETGSIAFSHAERVIMHVPNPFKALSEMTRVLRKGGKIAITEPDLSSVRIYPSPSGISTNVVKKWCSYTENPTIGADLLNYFHSLSLNDVKITARTLQINSYQEINQMRSLQKLVTALVGNGEISEQYGKEYSKSLLDADQNGRFLFYVTVYTAIGTK